MAPDVGLRTAEVGLGPVTDGGRGGLRARSGNRHLELPVLGRGPGQDGRRSASAELSGGDCSTASAQHVVDSSIAAAHCDEDRELPAVRAQADGRLRENHACGGACLRDDGERATDRWSPDVAPRVLHGGVVARRRASRRLLIDGSGAEGERGETSGREKDHLPSAATRVLRSVIFRTAGRRRGPQSGRWSKLLGVQSGPEPGRCSYATVTNAPG